MGEVEDNRIHIPEIAPPPDQGASDTVPAQARLAAIVESSDDAIISKDLNGVITSWNDAAERMFGFDASEAIGKSVTILIPHERLAEEPRILASIRRGERVNHYETVRMRKDGRQIEVSLTVSPVKDAAGQIVGASKIARDITSRKQNEKRLEMLTARMASDLAAMKRLQQVSTRLVQTGDVSQLLHEILDAALEITEANMGCVQLLENDALRIRAHRNFAAPFLKFFDVVHECEAATGTALKDRSRIVIRDILNSPIFAGSPALEVLLAAGVRAVQATPLIGREGRLLGMLSTHYRAPNEPGPHELSVLDLLARQAADFIERERHGQRMAEQARLLDLSNDGIIIRDAADCITYWSHGAEQIYGWRSQDVLGRNVFELLRPEFREPLEKIRGVLQEQGRWTGEVTQRRRDGTQIRVETRWAIARATGGHAISVLETDNDITKRAHAENALRVNEARLRGQKEAFQAAAKGAALSESLGILARTVAQETGEAVRTSFFIAGSDSSDLRSIRGAGSMPDSCTAIVDRFPVGLEAAATGAILTRDVFADPSWAPLLHLAKEYGFRGCALFPIETRDNKPIGAFAMYFREPHDATAEELALAEVVTQTAAIIVSRHAEAQERARASETLRQSEERLRVVNADLEQFAYAASHDLQEPIRNIAIYGEALSADYGNLLDSQGRQYIEFIRGGARRMELLVKNLLAYTQATNCDQKAGAETDAQEALNKALANLAEARRESGAVVSHDALPTVRMHAAQLEQIFQNIIGNAIKYRRDNEDPLIRVVAERDGAWWRFSVEDNGIGIAPQYKERVFGLFKRLNTEQKYSGSGIGLAICQRTVQRYGGRIWVESEGIGKGSTFLFTVPA